MNVDEFISHKTGLENEEIPNKLYSWFEEKGLVNKLRAHIREQIITSLKDSPRLNTNKNVSSPKVLAINLLVADFLMNQDNLFTLSVFTTEVPLLGNLQEFSSYVNRLSGNTQNTPVNKPSFQIKDVQDILEALGIQSNSEVTELTCHYYLNDDKNKVHSLLMCMFKAFTTIRNNLSKSDEVQNNKSCSNKSAKIESNTYEHQLNSWLVSVEDVLSSFNLNAVQINTIKKLLKRYHQNNIAQETALYRENLKKLEKQNMEMIEKVAELENILATRYHSCDYSLLFQKEQVECVTQKLRLEQQQLYKLINMFEEKEKSIEQKLQKSEEEYNKKLKDVENQKYELKLKEMEILSQEKMLKEESMKYSNETKIIEVNQVKQLQEQNIDLAKQLHEIKSKLDELEEYKKNEQIRSKTTDNKRIETSLDREMTRKLERENNELREFIKVQRQRIEELSSRALNLAKQIEKTHQVPLTSSTDYQTKYVKKKLHFVDDTSKKNRFANQNISSTTTDYSTTVLESDNQTEDDLIQDARSRLKLLETNTAKVEQNLKHFQTNQMHHNTDYKVIKVNRKSYNDIRSNMSEDSDFSTFKNNSNRINLKELANKIGYHRSVRRSMNTSPSENDTSPEILKNTRFQNYGNVTSISPVKISTNNIHKESSVKIPSLKNNDLINQKNAYTELSMNRTNTSTQTQIESKVFNNILSDTFSPELHNSENQTLTKTICDVNLRNYTTSPNKINKSDRLKESDDKQNDDDYNDVNSLNSTKSIENPTTAQQNSLIKVNNSSSKNDQEGDYTISFGSNKTDKSSDFWA